MASATSRWGEMLDELPWAAPNAALRTAVRHSVADTIVDARRCTVQLENGFLYLDALATPATALLGHDRPDGSPARRETLLARLSDFDPDYRCVALAANAELAQKLAKQYASRLGRPHMVDASMGESNTSATITIAIENESLGRSGAWLASSTWQNKPEIIVLGESLALGAEFGALLVATRVAERMSLDRVVAAPPEATVALAAAVVAAVEDERLIEGGRHLAAYFRERLESVRASCRQFVSLDISGLTARIGFVPGLPALRVKKSLCERGVLVGVDGGNHLVIMPPLATRPAEIDVISGSLRGALLGTPTSRMSACCATCRMMVD